VTAENHVHGATATGVRSEYHFHFVPTRQDYVALVRDVPMLRAGRAVAWTVLVLLALLVLARFFVVDAEGDPVGDPDVLAALVALGTPTALFLLGYARLSAHVGWRKPQSREPVHAVLDADGFSHVSPSGSQSMVWGVASRARETSEAYYVDVPSGLASMVYWLPKRAVPVGEQAAVRAQIQAQVPRYRIR
jgi:hypothetical protein